jgi:hypothetical protein
MDHASTVDDSLRSSSERHEYGGRADVFLDGTRAGEIDTYIPPDTTDNALWHTYGLPNTKHTVRIVTRADKAPNSKGTVVTLTGAVAYRPR